MENEEVIENVEPEEPEMYNVLAENPDMEKDMEDCQECKGNVAFGMYLNVCMNTPSEDGEDRQQACQDMLDKVVEGDMSVEEVKQAIRDQSGDEQKEILNVIDMMENNDDLDDVEDIGEDE